MVKTISKAIVSRTSTVKRVRGVKSRLASNLSRKTKVKAAKIQTKPFDMNYYLKPKVNFLLDQEGPKINQLLEQEETEFMEYMEANTIEVKNYSQEHRVKVLIGLKDIIYQIIDYNSKLRQQNQSQEKPLPEPKFPDNFESSVIALFERYLYKVGKDLSKNELKDALFSSLIYIDKEQNLCVFDSSRFSQKSNFELSLDFLRVVDLVIYPVKIYDYFEMFFLRISQQKKYDKKYQRYVERFKNVFNEMNFYFCFNENSKIKRPSNNFVSCLCLTYNFIKKNYSLENDIVLKYINYYKMITKYSIQDYEFCKSIISESKKVYDYFVNLLNVNKKCKEGLINGDNIDFI